MINQKFTDFVQENFTAGNTLGCIRQREIFPFLHNISADFNPKMYSYQFKTLCKVLFYSTLPQQIISALRSAGCLESYTRDIAIVIREKLGLK